MKATIILAAMFLVIIALGDTKAKKSYLREDEIFLNQLLMQKVSPDSFFADGFKSNRIISFYSKRLPFSCFSNFNNYNFDGQVTIRWSENQTAIFEIYFLTPKYIPTKCLAEWVSYLAKISNIEDNKITHNFSYATDSENLKINWTISKRLHKDSFLPGVKAKTPLTIPQAYFNNFALVFIIFALILLTLFLYTSYLSNKGILNDNQ